MEKTIEAYPSSVTGRILRAADLILDPEKGEVRRDGQRLHLEDREFQLLEYFMRNKNRIIPRSDLIRDVWKQEIHNHTMDAKVSSLRKKIDRSFSTRLLYTVSRKGYMMLG